MPIWVCMENLGDLSGIRRLAVVCSQIAKNKPGQTRRITVVSLNRSADVGLAVNPAPIDNVAGIACNLADKLAQRAAVTFPEGMQDVQFAKIVAGTLAEPLGR